MKKVLPWLATAILVLGALDKLPVTVLLSGLALGILVQMSTRNYN